MIYFYQFAAKFYYSNTITLRDNIIFVFLTRVDMLQLLRLWFSGKYGSCCCQFLLRRCVSFESSNSVFFEALDQWLVSPIFVKKFMLVVGKCRLKGIPEFIGYHWERLNHARLVVVAAIVSTMLLLHALQTIFSRCMIWIDVGCRLDVLRDWVRVHGLVFSVLASWRRIIRTLTASPYSALTSCSLLLLWLLCGRLLFSHTGLSLLFFTSFLLE